MLKRFIETTTLLAFFSSVAFAQVPPSSGVTVESGVLDGVYVPEHVPTKRVIQYTHLREADVMWSKRVWRTIDLRENMNHPLYYPEVPISDRRSLFDVIKYGVLEEGSLTIYALGATFDDQFKAPVLRMTSETEADYKNRVASYFGTSVLVPVFDANGDPVDADGDGVEDYRDTTTFYDTRELIKYEIKEDWFFDKQRSVLDVRIIGICPVVYDIQQGQILGEKGLFWLYFPECRYVFQNFFVYNPGNDAQRMSYDDLFWKRQFSSYIHKESNIFDRMVSPSWVGVEALLESEKIKGEMFQLEHDLWNL
jgi:gliding motility associated protien GldN